VMEFWEERTYEERLQSSKETKRWIAGEKSRSKQVMCYNALILSVDNVSESWVVDSGASFHATPHRKHFVDYVQGDFGQVHFGDDAPCKIVGMRKVKIKQRNGNQWLLKEVRHVPNLRKNIISTGKLESEGCISIFIDKVWKVTK
jgi:hypothetical protein